ncbi:MAG: hypothetical protein IKJ01_10410 [Lachnospiraceae bacterium]|nr:hypothetical protein [Lachnospiraceae bacterium]
MKNNVLKTLTQNLGFKILAVIFAFTLWLIVYNIDDPTVTRKYTINVTVENLAYLEKLNKYHEVIEGTNKVTFSATANRSILDKIDESDFIATANMEHIAIDEVEEIGRIPIDISCSRYSSSVKLSDAVRYYKVSLEDLRKKQFVVTPEVNGTVAEGYALGEVSVVAPNVLEISGPASIVQNISNVKATINVNDMYMNLTNNVVPELYDKEGKEIDTTRLKISNDTVMVSAKILKIKEVPITIKTTGAPAENYVVASLSSNPTTVQLKGSTATLNSISAIEIPADVVNIEGAVDDITAAIDIIEYLPEGVEVVDKHQATIDITVVIEAIKSKVFSILTKDIQVTGLSNEAEISFVHSSVGATILGRESDINALAGTVLKGNIDVTDLGVGTHQLHLMLDIDNAKYAYEDVIVSVVISEKNQQDINASTQSSQTENNISSESR